MEPRRSTRGYVAASAQEIAARQVPMIASSPALAEMPCRLGSTT
jgi:hypothetical protein